MTHQKNIIITGAAGFIGSNIARALNERGYKNLTLVDMLPHPRAEDPKAENMAGLQYTDYMHADELRDKIVRKDFSGIDVMIHMGACVDTRERDWAYLYRNNIEYSKTLFDFCVRSGCQFLYASSAATYGDGSKGYRDTNLDLKSLNLYGMSKHAFDLLAAASVQKPPQWAGFKFFNVYGPGERHKEHMASVVFRGFEQIRETGELKLFKSYKSGCAHGEQRRDFLYVGDAARVVCYFIDHPESSGIFNVGTGKARTFLELGNALFVAMGKEPNITFIDMPTYLKDQYQYFTQADITRLREVGYTAEFMSLEDGVKDYVQHYLMKTE